MTETAKTISKMFGNVKVNYSYNPTSMQTPSDTLGYIKDLSQATTQKFGKITEEVSNLVSHLSTEVSKIGSKGRVVHIAHSQGALITYLAARHLTQAQQERIEVVCFGGAAALTSRDFPHFARRVNYYSCNDPLLHVVSNAAKALNTGFLGGFTQGGEPEFVFLTPKGNDPIIDHGLLGPTYSDIVAWEGRRYQEKFVPVSKRFIRRYGKPAALRTRLRFIEARRRVIELWKAVIAWLVLKFYEMKALVNRVVVVGLLRDEKVRENHIIQIAVNSTNGTAEG